MYWPLGEVTRVAGSISVSLHLYTFDCNYWQFELKLVLVLCHVNPSKSNAFDFGIKIARSCLRMMTLS